METKMVSYIIQFRKNLTIIFSNMALWLILTYVFFSYGNYTHAAIFFAVFAITSLILSLNIHLWLNNKIVITIVDKGFIFDITKKNELITKEYPFSEIKAYQFEFSGKEKNVPIFRIFTKDGKTDKYVFITKKDDEDQLDVKLLAKSLHLSIQKYNKDKAEDQKIEFRPSFAATKAGFYIIVFLGVANAMVIIVMLILSAKGDTMTRSFMLFIGGTIPFFSLLLARISGLNFRKEMMKYAEKELR